MPKVTIQPAGDLYCHYHGQTNPQPCYIELDCKTGSLIADYNGEIGGAVPFSVWHGHDRRWGIPALKEYAADELMEELAPLCQRILDGYSSDWDGHNMVAHFTEDAMEAEEDIERILSRKNWDDEDIISVWDAGDWLQGTDCGVTAATTDEELDKMAEEIENDADVRLEGTRRHLEWLREKAQQKQAE